MGWGTEEDHCDVGLVGLVPEPKAVRRQLLGSEPCKPASPRARSLSPGSRESAPRSVRKLESLVVHGFTPHPGSSSEAIRQAAGGSRIIDHVLLLRVDSARHCHHHQLHHLHRRILTRSRHPHRIRIRTQSTHSNRLEISRFRYNRISGQYGWHHGFESVDSAPSNGYET